jgi:hypothetical protein
MKNCLLLFLGIFMLLTISHGQEASKFGVKFSGFVKTDMLWDSRQGVSARVGHFYLYPLNEKPDVNGDDINARSSFNILSIQTRLRALATGPDVWGAKTSAFVEGAFFGSVNANINTFRLRHAFVKLAWPKTQLLVGQYWHPMFNVRNFPGTISFNTGAPFQPFARNPQVRLTQYFGKFNVAFTAMSQRDFLSNGPNGASCEYLRNSGIPAIDLRLEYYNKNVDNGNEFLMGISANYKALLPRLATLENYKTGETAKSGAFTGYAKYKNKDVTFKLNGYYGGDAFDLTMLGGYAVTDSSDATGLLEEYSCIRNLSIWSEIHSNGETWQLGLFGGYSKNMGSSDVIVGEYYSRGSDIDYLYRISPRVIYNSGQFRIAPEIEYTVAAYATKDESGKLNRDEKGKITDSKTVGNFRFLLGVYFFF